MTQTHPFHMVPRPNPPFTRDRLTWLSYGMLIYFSYFQTILGPALPFLQADLHLSYGMAAWHFSAFGCGMIFAGLTADVLSRQPGRAAIFWGGGGGMTLGGMLIVLGHQEWMTLTGALAMGSFGTLLLVGIQAALADRHEERQGIALAEANIGASLGAGLSAFCVAGFALMGVNWRGTLVVPVIALCALSVVGRREALGHTSQSTGGGETLYCTSAVLQTVVHTLPSRVRAPSWSGSPHPRSASNSGKPSSMCIRYRD